MPKGTLVMIALNEPPSRERNHRLSRDLTYVPAAELARNNGVRMRGQSADYRKARDLRQTEVAVLTTCSSFRFQRVSN